METHTFEAAVGLSQYESALYHSILSPHAKEGSQMFIVQIPKRLCVGTAS